MPVATPPPSTETPEYFADAASRFDSAINPEPEKKKEAPAAPEKKEQVQEKPKAEVKKSESDIEVPTEILTGDKPKEGDDAPPVDEEEKKILEAELPANASDEIKANLVNQRKLIGKVAAERDALREEIKALKAQQKTGPDEATEKELKALRAQVADMEANLEASAFERSPKFREFVARENQQIEAAKAYLEGSEIKPDIIESAARASGPRRLAILQEAGADANMIAVLSPYLAAYDQIQGEKKNALAASKTLSEQWEAQEKQRAEQKEAALRKHEDEVFTKVSSQIDQTFEPFIKVKGADKWNAQADQLNAEAKEFFNGNLPLERIVEIAKYGVGARVIHKLWTDSRAEAKALKARLAELEAALPNAGDRAGSSKTSVEDEKGDYFENAGKRFEATLGR